jgi:phosphorylcholine metabolism protein LicD
MSSYSKMMRWELDKFTFTNDSKSIIKKKEALDNLIELDKLFRELNVEYWLTCGTLLGFYRDNDFIAHDKDTDICVNSEHFNGYVLKRILSKGFKIHKCFGELEDGFEISFFRNGVKTDIFLFYKNEDKWYNSVYADFTSIDCLKFDYVYEPFEISENIFLGYSFKTPKNIEHFLKQQYGDNFMIPNKNWIWWKSPKNLKDTNIRIPYTNLDKLSKFDKNIHLDKLTILIKSFLRKGTDRDPDRAMKWNLATTCEILPVTRAFKFAQM